MASHLYVLILLSVISATEGATSLKYPNDGKEYLFYGYIVNNEGNKWPCSTKPVTGRIHQTEGDEGVFCGNTDSTTPAGTKSKDVYCAEPIQGIYVEVKAQDGNAVNICKLDVIARPVCKLPEVWDDDSGQCAVPKNPCIKSLDGSSCVQRCPANSIQKGYSCVCNAGFEANGNDCRAVSTKPVCSSERFQYCHRRADCWGRDIRYIKTDSEACKKACSEDCKCKSVQSKGNNCWLKHHKCSITELSGWNSDLNDWVKINRGQSCDSAMNCDGKSYNYCHRINKDCYGRDIKHIKADLDQCQKACSEECRCKSVQHNKDNCWLKHHACSEAELSNGNGVNDYVKVQRGESCGQWTLQQCTNGMFDFCHRRADCYGRDIRHVNGNAETCKKACSEDCKCKSVQANGNNCWLKHHKCSIKELSGWNGNGNDWVKVNRGQSCDSAMNCEGRSYRYCQRANRDCNGRDIQHIKGNLDQCQKACSEECRCKSVQHNKDNCWLKHHACSVAELSNINGANDYVRVDKGAGC